MRVDIPTGTVVEVTDRGGNNFQYAVIVDQPEGRVSLNDDTFVWVRYENGSVVPIDEYYIRALTNDQIVARLNELVFPRS